MERPGFLPPRVPWSAVFWDALADGRLLLAWCAACATATYPPVESACPGCGAEWTWRRAAGTGRLWSWTTIHREYVADYPLPPPYTVLMVDLPEGVRMLATLASGVDPARLRPDAALEFVPRALAPGAIIPGFRPVP